MQRTREHPEQRFAIHAEFFDWAEQARSLAQEPCSGRQGHRQKALIHEGNMTVALYTFDRGSALPEHVVDGVVLIQVLRGHLRVQVQEQAYEMTGGQALRLSRGIHHDVQALEPTEMLLTVAIEGPDSHSDQ